MSYPDPVYLGDSGEPSGTLRRTDHAPDIDTHGQGTDCHYLATGELTRGQFGLYRWEMGAKRGGPDPHFHRSISESFYVLEGSVRLYDGRQWVDGNPGDFLFVPEGGVHGFRNESGEKATMLILFAPGAPREDYFETLADPDRRAALQDPAVAEEFYLRHDTFWVDG